MTTLEERLRAGADPDGAVPRLQRFVESGGALPADEDGTALLAAIFESGSLLSDFVLSEPALFEALRADPLLRRPKGRAQWLAEARAAAEGAVDFADLERRLRLYRRREVLRLGARELGWGDTLEVARELSFFADACLEVAVAFCDAQLSATHGAPTSPEGAPSFVVLAMGKLGGEELNFSSDIDVIYLYSTDEGAAGALTLHEYYARLSQMVTRALSEITDDGLIFRVDLRLRPEGRSGAICNSLAAAERYYETFGRTWERQALLRARPCAGDLALGQRFLRMVEPFVYPRSVGPGAIDEVRALRRMFRESAGGPAFNVKLDAGGIRDVELVAQLLQLLHGGKRRDVRDRTTLPALGKLALAGLVSGEEVRLLTAAYRLWRRLEHRVQLEHGAQTHDLPADGPGLERFARKLGTTRAALDDVIAEHRRAVSAIADTLGEPEAGPPAVVLRLLDPAASRERIEAELRAAGFRAVESSAESLELARARIPPEWLAEAIESPDPDRALGLFRDLALRGSLGVFALLREEPQLLRILAGLFGTSERLSRHLISHPALWQPLLEGLGAPRLAPETWRTALAERLDGLDYEEALREMRRYQAQEILRLGLHDVAGNLEADEVCAQLCALAEACVAAALNRVAEALEPRFGRPDATLTVLAFGSFGAREMRYGSDLDLVFLYSRPGETDKGIDHQEWFARLAQRLISALGALLDEGRLYEVDTRLRPSGAQGLLVTSFASFDRYHQEEAAVWERVALLRARPVFVSTWPTGEPPVDFEQLLTQIAYTRPLADETVRAELVRVRGRIEAERAREGDGVHLRLSPGGLTDLEFVAAHAQLRDGGADTALRTTTPLEALSHLVARGDLDPALLEDYRFLQRASLRLRLLRDRPDDHLRAEDRPHLARSLGLSEAQLDEALASRMRRVRAVFSRRLAPG